MRLFLCTVGFLLMVPSLLYGQSEAHADSSPNDSGVGAKVKALREALLRTHQQVAAQQEEIENLRVQLKAGLIVPGSAVTGSTASEAISPSPMPPNGNPPDLTQEIHKYNVKASIPAVVLQATQAGPKVPSTSIKFCDAVLTIGGFVDFENIFRTTNTQSNITTDLGGIPYPLRFLVDFRHSASRALPELI